MIKSLSVIISCALTVASATTATAATLPNILVPADSYNFSLGSSVPSSSDYWVNIVPLFTAKPTQAVNVVAFGDLGGRGALSPLKVEPIYFNLLSVNSTLDDPFFAGLWGGYIGMPIPLSPELADGNFSIALYQDTKTTDNFLGLAVRRTSNINPQDRTPWKIISLSSEAAVPEPKSWALMLIGFSAVGYAARRKRRVAALV